MNVFNIPRNNFNLFILCLHRKPSIWTLSMAASKFEDRLDASHCNIESYFSKGNSSLNTSASTSSNYTDIDQSSDSVSKTLKSNKSETSDRSITSYFKKKQETEVKSFDEIGVGAADKDINEDNKELDSFLSVCNDMNSFNAYNDKSHDTNIEKTFTVMENIVDVFPNEQSKPIQVLESKEQPTCNDVNFIDTNDDDFIDSKVETASISSRKSKTILSNEPDKSVGFFARKLKEQSKLSFDIEFEKLSDSSNDKADVIKTDEAPNTSATKTVLLDNQSKPLSFFARKLKEKSESNFSVISETSCDSLSNESVLKTNQTEYQKIDSSGASFSTFTHEQSSSSISDVNESSVNLDPELTKLCEQCNKRIPIWEETEHLDYHFALNMSKELSNSYKTNNIPVTGKNVAQKLKSGRKRGNATKSTSLSKKPLVKTKTIDSFFKS